MNKKKRTQRPTVNESAVNSTARILTQALEKTASRAGVSPSECEKLSSFLNQAYSTRNRAFHNISHAHDVTAVTSGSATAQLAALFHDVVYFQIDWVKQVEIRDLFSPFTVTENHDLIIPKIKNNPWANALITLFGFREGQQILPFCGLNEFLSAWVAIRKLQDKVTTLNLFKIVTCIQATIPLWVSKTPALELPQILRQNLQLAAKHLGARTSTDFLDNAVAEAVEMANLDVMSFAYENPRKFLYNSWALVGESNPALQGSLFTISQYRDAIAKMEAFFSELKSNAIFREFNHVPKPMEMKRLQKAAERNLKIGSLYILLRLLDTCLIESIALLTGGDAPLEMFIGPKATRREREPSRIELFLDYKIPVTKRVHKSPVVLELLSAKNAFRSAFDTKGAPLSHYLYERMTKMEQDQAIQAVRKYIKKEISPSDYLTSLPKALVLAVIKAAAKIAFTRKDRLEILARQFELLKKQSA